MSTRYEASGSEEAESRTPQRVLAVVGVLGAVLAIVTTTLVGDTFGFPGSSAYRTYEAFNRVMAVLLLAQVAGVVAFFLRYRSRVSTAGHVALVGAVVCWIGMALGNGLEF